MKIFEEELVFSRTEAKEYDFDGNKGISKKVMFESGMVETFIKVKDDSLFEKVQKFTNGEKVLVSFKLTATKNYQIDLQILDINKKK